MPTDPGECGTDEEGDTPAPALEIPSADEADGQRGYADRE